MKILYAVQATGNGHISRAMELLPHLQRRGDVDIFLSGDNSNLSLDAPIRFRSKGLSLYFNNSGGLDYAKIIRNFRPLALRREIAQLPVEKYDLVINDFEFITAASCAKKGVPSVQLGHQASFQSPHAPRPGKRSRLGEWLLLNYAKSSHYIGLHFEQYASFILPPVIKKEIRDATPRKLDHVTVYLPAYKVQQLVNVFHTFCDHQFQVFTKQVTVPEVIGNILLLPVNKAQFNKSLIDGCGVITGAGFETPAEALHLGKKLLCIPIRGQYEQLCNAAALSRLGVACHSGIHKGFNLLLTGWLNEDNPIKINYHDTIPTLVERLMEARESIEAGPFSDSLSPVISMLYPI